MISIKVDEAFGYDLLAIAVVKVSHNLRDAMAESNRSRLTLEMIEQVGDALHFKVVESAEYLDLCRVNNEMYVRIDELKSRGEQPGDATFIDSRVYKRYLAKKKLQDRWFPKQPLTEQKIGYDKNLI